MRLRHGKRRDVRLSASSSATATTTRTTGPRAAPERAILVPTAERDAAIGLSIFQADFPRRPGAHVQLARRAGDDPGGLGQSRRARGRRGHRLGSAGQPAAGAVPPEVRHPRAVCGLRRPHRREQRLPGAVRVLRGLPPQRFDAALARPDRQLAAADSAASAHPAPRLPRRRRQVRRDGGGRAADHAVVLREPVDGGARGVGARPARARQRRVRRAEGPVPSAATPASTTKPHGVRRDAAGARTEPLAERDAGPERPSVLPRALRLAGHRAEVSRHVRAAREGTGRSGHRAAARLVRAPPEGSSAGEEVVAALAAGPAARSEPSYPSQPPAMRPPPPPPPRRFGADRGHNDTHRRGSQPRRAPRPQRPGGA